jgi:adenine-specific DNA-methyltransferase
MAKKVATEKKSEKKREISAYTHEDKQRAYNPPVGLVTPDTDKDSGKKQYAYDPHLDPSLSWAGKAEHTSFEVPTVSLHVHERIDPKTIIQAVKKKNGSGQPDLFHWADEDRPIREAIEFYKHKDNWTNRLIAGDSLLVMNSLLEKEGMAGQVQMVYIDPPYGISYGSNFQPFINNKIVKDGRDSDLTAEPEMIRAFRDTWELGIHSYLTYMRDRLKLSRELLNESGSCFVQISDGNVHHIRELMDEIFGATSYVGQISFKTKKMSLGRKYLGAVNDYILWYAKDIEKLKFRRLFIDKPLDEDSPYAFVELPDGTRRRMTKVERKDQKLLPSGSKVFRTLDLHSSGRTESCVFDFEFNGRNCTPSRGKSWKTNRDGIKRLIEKNRLVHFGATPEYVLYHDDFPVTALMNVWEDTQGESDKKYVVQTSEKVIQRCMLMSTDPGDLVFDPTCGSGTSASVAEQWGRRWITCDTSRVAVTVAKQRIVTETFDYFRLLRSEEGVSSGFQYETAPHITLGSVANSEPSPDEVLFDRPLLDKSKARVAGPFTMEAVPAPTVKPLDDVWEVPVGDASIARSGETLRQADWQEELLKTGIRGKGGQRIEFSRVEPLAGARYLHADAETKTFRAGESRAGDRLGGEPQRVVVSFGPDHAPLEQRQVAMALEEAQNLVPKPKIIVFAAFQFDPEASKDIDETNWPGVTLLKAQMNADLLTEDLKKKRSSNESFWLIGQPDVKLTKIEKGDDKGKHKIDVLGFDYYDTRTGEIVSGGSDKIAMWMLDTDYDGRSIFPRQVFFPMSGSGEGWAKLAKNLKAEIDEEKIEAFHGTSSLPFDSGENKRVAVKIIDDRGIESLKIIMLQG